MGADVDLRSFEDVMQKTTCVLHPLILRTCLGHLDRFTGVSFDIKVYPRQCTITIRGGQLKERAMQREVDFAFLPQPPEIGSRRLGRAVDPHWIDNNLFRQWKGCCDGQHNKTCQATPGSSQLASTRPAWLIDTLRLCLIPGDNNAPYVALSYVCKPLLIFVELAC
jgi:hypothetical protein